VERHGPKPHGRSVLAVVSGPGPVCDRCLVILSRTVRDTEPGHRHGVCARPIGHRIRSGQRRQSQVRVFGVNKVAKREPHNAAVPVGLDVVRVLHRVGSAQNLCADNGSAPCRRGRRLVIPHAGKRESQLLRAGKRIVRAQAVEYVPVCVQALDPHAQHKSVGLHFRAGDVPNRASGKRGHAADQDGQRRSHCGYPLTNPTTSQRFVAPPNAEM
jgi:hypothetical protein